MTAGDTSSEQHRHECEARHWLRQGHTDRIKVDELIARIEQRRGIAAAIALRNEMRRQWELRHEWQGEPA